MGAVIVFVDQEDWTLQGLRSLKGKAGTWTVPSKAQTGDLVYWYMKGPVSEFVAVGKYVDKYEPKQEKSGRWNGLYMGKVQLKRVFPQGVPRSLVRSRIRNWGWLKNPRRATRVPAEYESKFVRLMGVAATALGREPASQRIISRSGAGYGDPEKNRKVEKAAIGAVKRELESKGYKVVSVETQNLGYDLECRRENTMLCVEVKGVSGAIPSFIFTANELATLKKEKNFKLAVVLNALKRSTRTVHFFDRSDVLSGKLAPIAYKVDLSDALRARS